MPDTVRLTTEAVTRGVMRGTKLHVESLIEDHHHRAWRDIREMLAGADLPEAVRRNATAAFAVLADAEAHVHGTDPEDVHFHEVGAWDSIADVVGVCSAVADLGVERVLSTGIGTGDGFVRGAHGVVPVPVPAVLRLLEESDLDAHGVPRPTDSPVGELATPTGVALLVALTIPASAMPSGTMRATGIGAGTKDGLPWANVVRAVLVETAPGSESVQPEATDAAALTSQADGDASDELRDLLVLEANIDDLDPRAWPSVIEALLTAGALDAWLTPIVMKKGRPAHTVSALVDPEQASPVRDAFFAHTTTLGVRESRVVRHALERTWHDVAVNIGGESAQVRIKVGHRDGRIVTATPEFDDVAVVATAAGVPIADALAAASAAAHATGLTPGASA